ncbi:MAG TPA: hypothetical protein VND94_01075 [Terriglobia bacterium]|nr:hypothetical protein [Terriglobia bacterium]
MKMLAGAAFAVLLLFGINGHASAGDACLSAPDKIGLVTAKSDGWVTDILENQTGALAQQSLAFINSIPEPSNDTADSLVFFRGTNAATKEVDNRVLLLTGGCVTAMYRLTPAEVAKLLGEGV